MVQIVSVAFALNTNEKFIFKNDFKINYTIIICLYINKHFEYSYTHF